MSANLGAVAAVADEDDGEGLGVVVVLVFIVFAFPSLESYAAFAEYPKCVNGAAVVATVVAELAGRDAGEGER